MWSTYQQDIFHKYETTDSNLTISAGPGSGKTTVLLEMLSRKKGWKKVAFLAFNKSMAEELKDRVPAGVHASTIHSFGLSMIRKNFHNVRVSQNKCRDMLDQLIEEHNKQASREDKLVLKGRKEKFVFSVLVQELSEKYRLNTCTSVAELEARVFTLGAVDERLTKLHFEWGEKLAKYIDQYNRSYKTSDSTPLVVDFVDMIHMPATLDLSIQQYHEVFVDECQDLSKLHQLIIFKMILPEGRFIAVGDPKQSLYAFLGSDIEAFDALKEQDNTINLTLPISYRCSKSVVQEANKIYPDIEAFEQNGEGEVASKDFTEAKDGDFVLCRTNKPLFEAYFQLLDSGTKCYIREKELGRKLIKMVEECKDMNRERAIAHFADKRSQIMDDIRSRYKIIDEHILARHPRVRSFEEKVEIIKYLSTRRDSMNQVLALLKSMFDSSNKEEGVALMTFHKAKGLEADSVYIIRMDLWPSPYATTPQSMQQERNGLFVAITRAKTNLYYA